MRPVCVIKRMAVWDNGPKPLLGANQKCVFIGLCHIRRVVETISRLSAVPLYVARFGVPHLSTFRAIKNCVGVSVQGVFRWMVIKRVERV
jgi:hypothetical protein